MAAARPRTRPREQIVHGFCDSEPRGARRDHDPARPAPTLFYALPDLGTGRNPNWERDRLPGPDRAAPGDAEASSRCAGPSGAEEVIEADVCVVGSGAGGGVIAGELAAAGQAGLRARDGRLLQRGRLRPARALGLPAPLPERRARSRPPRARSRSQSPGPGVGGGTVVNWTNCLRTHHWVREEWATRARPRGPRRPRLRPPPRRGLGAARRQRPTARDLNGPHQRLKEGVRGARLRLPADHPQRRPAIATTRASPATWASATIGLEAVDREDLPARRPAGRRADLSSDCRAERILVEDGRAAGVEGCTPTPSPPTEPRPPGSSSALRPVVVACGSLESPALLLRSGIGGPAVGDYLRLHPTAASPASTTSRRSWWWGPPQAALSHEFADLDDGYGFLIEAAQSTTGLIARRDRRGSRAASTSRMMRRWDHAAPLISLIRDRGHGRVDDRRRGNAVPSYPLTDELDIRDFRAGVEQLVRLHEAAGAERDPRQPAARRATGAAATTSRPSSRGLNARSLAPREYAALLRPPDGELPDGRRPARPRSPTRGASCTTRPVSGSATRAPSRPPPGRTRC